jgi:hypothetical protein
MYSASENNRSEGTEVPGITRDLFATLYWVPQNSRNNVVVRC